MVLVFRKFISEVFMNGKFPKIVPSEDFPLYGIASVKSDSYLMACMYSPARCFLLPVIEIKIDICTLTEDMQPRSSQQSKIVPCQLVM